MKIKQSPLFEPDCPLCQELAKGREGKFADAKLSHIIFNPMTGEMAGPIGVDDIEEIRESISKSREAERN